MHVAQSSYPWLGMLARLPSVTLTHSTPYPWRAGLGCDDFSAVLATVRAAHLGLHQFNPPRCYTIVGFISARASAMGSRLILSTTRWLFALTQFGLLGLCLLPHEPPLAPEIAIRLWPDKTKEHRICIVLALSPGTCVQRVLCCDFEPRCGQAVIHPGARLVCCGCPHWVQPPSARLNRAMHRHHTLGGWMIDA